MERFVRGYRFITGCYTRAGEYLKLADIKKDSRLRGNDNWVGSEYMKEEIGQIKAALERLESIVQQDEPGVSSPFSGLELPDIMRDVVDLLFPFLGIFWPKAERREDIC